MKIKHKILLISSISILLTSLHAHASETSYLCESKSSSGFLYNKSQKKWESTNFYANKNFIVKHQGKRWVVKYTGDIMYIDCDAKFDNKGFLHCNGQYYFEMNNKTLRFIYINKDGYVVSNPVQIGKDKVIYEEAYSPNMEIGKCTKI